jgi:hypothetical protein
LASPEIRERIFERGITTKTRGDHGIGLYLIESYVTQAGGAIEVADNTPRGAIFSLFIPPREPPGNWKTPTMQHELIDVLIVEDENELAQLHAELIANIRVCGWWALPRRWLTRRQSLKANSRS